MYSEAEMSHEEMQRAVDQGYRCAQCQNILTIAWGGAYNVNSYVLRCGKDATHKGITRHDKKYEQKLKEGFSMDSNALMTMGEAKMLQRVEMARFPQDLTVAEKKLLAQVAITYGFDPLMGEVTIYEGRPYVNIDGRYRKAQETGRLDGVETRPATKKEREDWQIPEGDWFFRSEVYVKDASHAFIAWGRVRVSETKPGSHRQGDTTSIYKPIQNNPQRMAEKRAEAQALRKAFHIPLPSVEEIGSPDYDIESTAVDVTTGEITEDKPEKEKPKLGDRRINKDGVPEVYVKAGKDINVGPSEPQTQPQDSVESKKKPLKTESNGNLPAEPEEEAGKPSKFNEDWLKETLQIIKWKPSTALSWLKAQVKAEGTDLTEVLNSLPHEKLKIFIDHVSSMRESAGQR